MRILSIIVLPLAFGLNSVSAQFDVATLMKALGQEKVENLQTSNPQLLDYLLFKNEKAAYSQDLNGHKDISDFPDALDVQPVNDQFPTLTVEMLTSGFPVLGYQFPIADDVHGYYRIGDTGVLLIVYPEQLVKMLYDRQNQ